MSGEALLRDRLDKTTLTEGQKEAVALGLTGRGRFVGVQGYAGTGKTHMVETLRRYAERAGFTVEGAAPTNKAAAELASAVPAAGTVARFLLADAPGDKKRSILVVDEAGMISTRDMHALMTKANELRYARVILVGDVKQLDPVSAGSPFAQLQKAGMPTAIMADIQRQRNEDARKAVLHAIRGEVRAAFSRIEDLRTPEKNQSFTGEVARAWLGLHSSVRERTEILALTHRVRGGCRDQRRAEAGASEWRLGRDGRQSHAALAHPRRGSRGGQLQGR
ncbi:AAA family ATPase [Cereibacter sphaeroides]|uniref:AAA family ATPase n=1 Tax=Cereibacter sphaeroides TaxID=1063 RepID=UPI001FFCD60B|nr:AAA family ATPase [Cereibacter sphaeroides]